MTENERSFAMMSFMKREEQMMFANTGFERYSRQTKRAVFLDQVNAIVPWKRLCALISPHYPCGRIQPHTFLR
jgi:hypothetical protein